MFRLQSSFSWITGQPGAVRGAIWMVFAAVLFTGIPIVVRTLSDHMGPAEIIFFRSALGLVFMAPYFLWTGVRSLRTSVFKLHVQRSVINFIGMAMWFYALALIPLSQAVALHFTMPLFIVLLAALFLGERVGVGWHFSHGGVTAIVVWIGIDLGSGVGLGLMVEDPLGKICVPVWGISSGLFTEVLGCFLGLGLFPRSRVASILR